MRGHVEAERLEQVAAFVAVTLGRVDLVEQLVMAVVNGLQPRENSGFGHIRLPWRLETIRITATAVSESCRFPLARRREGRQRGRSRPLRPRGAQIGRNTGARSKQAIAVTDQRLSE